MKDWTKQNRLLLTLNAAVLLCITTAWIGYVLLGHRLIGAIYISPWDEFLHKLLMMEGQNILPLEHYFRGAEELMWSATLTGLILCSALILLVKVPPRITIVVLTPIFIIVGLLA